MSGSKRCRLKSIRGDQIKPSPLKEESEEPNIVKLEISVLAIKLNFVFSIFNSKLPISLSEFKLAFQNIKNHAPLLPCCLTLQHYTNGLHVSSIYLSETYACGLKLI